MKNFTLFSILISSLFSLGCFAQGSADMAGMGNGPSPTNIDEGFQIVSYHVEETINLKLGSRITTYNVNSLEMVNTNDLGPDNTRTVTPKYGKAKQRPHTEPVAAAISAFSNKFDVPTASTDIVIKTVLKAEPVVAATKTRDTTVKIDLINTYERVLDKGYQSVDLLKKVGNSRFFEGDLETAAKWYEKLFAMTNDLEEEYYYRYAASLKSIKQMDKANQMMAIFESKRGKGK